MREAPRSTSSGHPVHEVQSSGKLFNVCATLSCYIMWQKVVRSTILEEISSLYIFGYWSAPIPSVNTQPVWLYIVQSVWTENWSSKLRVSVVRMLENLSRVWRILLILKRSWVIYSSQTNSLNSYIFGWQIISVVAAFCCCRVFRIWSSRFPQKICELLLALKLSIWPGCRLLQHIRLCCKHCAWVCVEMNIGSCQYSEQWADNL